MIIFICILGWLVCALIGAALASERGRGTAGFLLGVLFGPIGIVIALLLPSRATGCRNQGMKNCPYCGTAMALVDVECPNCRRAQPPRPTARDWEKTVTAGDDVEKWAKSQKDDAS